MPFDATNFSPDPIAPLRVLTVEERQIINILEQARSGVIAGFWCKRRYHDRGKHCIVGWLSYVADGGARWSDDRARDFAQKYLGPALLQTYPGDDVISFNDHPDTQQGDIIALFDRAITRLQSAT